MPAVVVTGARLTGNSEGSKASDGTTDAVAVRRRCCFLDLSPVGVAFIGVLLVFYLMVVKPAI